MVLGCCKMGCWTTIKSFHVKIILLDKQELIQEIQGKTTGQDLLDEIFKYINIIERAYFGLRYQDNDNQTHWLDPQKRVSQQIKGVSPVTLYLGVKYYAADPCKLAEEITRYQFFLQVKLDILQGRLPVPKDLSIELAALALQSDIGNYDGQVHQPGYVSEFRFLASQTEDMEARVEGAHSRLAGLSSAQAENRYLEKVKWLDMYGVDLHPVIGEDSIDYFLGLTPSGIIVLRNRTKVGNYFWPRISKIYFKGIYFMLRVRDKTNDENTYGFQTPSKKACRHLYQCCVDHHNFFRLVQVNPTAAANNSGLFGLGSKLRASGRSEKDLAQGELSSEVRHRVPPLFTRVPSQRYSRRSRSEEAGDQRGRRDGEATLERRGKGGGSQHSLHTRHLSSNNLHESQGLQPRDRAASLPRVSLAMQSLPPEVMDSSLMVSGEADLSMRSLQYLESRGLFGSRNGGHQSRRGSEVDASHGPGSYSESGHRKSRSRRGQGGSDDESEVSGVSLASARHHRDRHRDSGSESESGRSTARKHHRRRKRSGSYKLVETDQQWREVQARQHQRGQPGVSEATVRRSGYVNSGAETESELVNTLRRNKRRQRSRSRSPSEARARLPTELVKHFEFGLVEPEESLNPQEIPYINVETQKPVKVRYGSNGRRSRHSSGQSANARRKLPVGDNSGAEETSLNHSSYNGHAPYQPQPLEQGSWQPPSTSQGYYQAHAQVTSLQTPGHHVSSHSLSPGDNRGGILRHTAETNNNIVKPQETVEPPPRPPHFSLPAHSQMSGPAPGGYSPSPVLGYKSQPHNTSLSQVSASPMSMTSLHNGLPMSSSSTASSSSSPRQPSIYPPPPEQTKTNGFHPQDTSFISNGYHHDQMPASLPTTGLTSLATSGYNPVYNNNHHNNSNNSPAARHFRQNGSVQPPRYGGPQRPGPASLQSPGVRQNNVNGGPPPPLGHAQYSRNWPPNPHNQMFDANHVKKMAVQGIQKRLGNQYEPSGDEMSTEL